MGRALSVIGVPTGAGPYSAALEGLTALDEYVLRANPQTPPLYASGVRYTKESTDKWRDLTQVLATKTGDCEALSTWRTAELRVSGEDPNASVVVYKTGPAKYHAVVLRGDGTLEDPSVELGMKPPAGLLDAYETWNQAIEMAPKQEDRPMVMGDDDDVACAVIGANNAPDDGEVVFDVIGTGEGWKGIVRVPMHDGRAIFAETSTSKTKPEAAAKAHRVLGVIGSFWDDLAILVPSATGQAAIRLAKNTHVQNLAKDVYQAGKRVIGKGDKAQPASSLSIVDRMRFARRMRDQDAADAAAESGEYIPPGATEPLEEPVLPGEDLADGSAMYFDEGQGAEPYGEHGEFVPPDLMGWDLVEMNGVLCGIDEVNCLGHINEALARGSQPRTVIGRAARGGGGRTAARGGGGRTAARTGGGRTAARGGGGSTAARAASSPYASSPYGSSPYGSSPYGASPYGASPYGSSPYGASPYGSSPYGASPYGSSPYGGSSYGSRFGGGGLPPGVNPQSARAAAMQQFQRNQQANAMLSQPGGGGGGGGGGGYDGGGYGTDYTPADAAADQQADADLYNAYYQNQAFQDAESAYYDTAQEVSPDQFFGAVNPYQAEQMLEDDSIPAQ